MQGYKPSKNKENENPETSVSPEKGNSQCNSPQHVTIIPKITTATTFQVNTIPLAKQFEAQNLQRNFEMQRVQSLVSNQHPNITSRIQINHENFPCSGQEVEQETNKEFRESNLPSQKSTSQAELEKLI